jgi:hypothetical protein
VVDVILNILQTEKEGEPGIDDAATFFAHIFGGDRFEDYVSHSHIPVNCSLNEPALDRRNILDERDDGYRNCHG